MDFDAEVELNTKEIDDQAKILKEKWRSELTAQEAKLIAELEAATDRAKKAVSQIKTNKAIGATEQDNRKAEADLKDAADKWNTLLEQVKNMKYVNDEK